VKPLFGSKKASLAIFASLISAFGIERGWSVEQILFVVSPLMIFLPAQAITDRARANAGQNALGNKPTVVKGPKAPVVEDAD